MENKILIIAGSDSCGGAGVQADIKTATTLKTYCSSAITCLTAQNSQKVHAIFYPPVNFLNKQIKVVLDDFKIDAIKIGMLGNYQITKCITKILKEKAKNIPLILDPVMVATSGDKLLKKNALTALKKLISNSYLITPNIDEAEILSEMKITNLKDIKIAARKIQKIGAKNVFIKGGHLNSKNKIINFLLKENGGEQIFTNKKLPFKNIHGTGCTLSTAITCFISHGLELETSIKNANSFVYKTIKNSKEIGLGSRILKHY
jgi:hydroxymethylpyrimidine/phosphomethylpyrimidine kinase